MCVSNSNVYNVYAKSTETKLKLNKKMEIEIEQQTKWNSWWKQRKKSNSNI